MNCMVLGNKQSNLYIETQLFPKDCQTSIQNIYLTKLTNVLTDLLQLL